MRIWPFMFLLVFHFSLMAQEPVLGEALDYGEPPDYREHYFEEIRYLGPIREYSIIVTEEGFYPKYLSVFEGEKVKFYVTSTLKEASCFTLPSHNIFLAANPGRINEGEVIFKKSGRYPFMCPGKNWKGTVSVLKKKKAVRNIASKPRIWMPKDY